MLHYGLYARKSDKERDDVIKSNEDQKSVCLSLATRDNLFVPAVYEENKTAKLPGVRPVYRQMIGDLKRGKINAILVYHVNRLARNMEEGGALAQMLIDGKVKEIRTPHAVYRPGDNILPLLLEQGMSTQQSLDLSERITVAARETAASGGWSHKAPPGYVNRRHPINTKKGVAELDLDRHTLVRRMFDLLLTGAYSVREVADTANDEWGFRVRGTVTQPERKLLYSAAYAMFTNPFYAGMVRHNGALYPGNHPPLITADEFNRIQAILRSRGHARRRRHAFAYSGFIRCGLCGQQVCGEEHTKRQRVYVYYRCSDTYRRCTKRSISEQRLEQQVLDVLDRITIDEQLAAVVLESLLKWEGLNVRSHEDLGAKQEQALAAIEEKRTRLLDLALSGAIADQETYRTKDAELLAERNRLVLERDGTREKRQRARETLQAAVSFMWQARSRFLSAEAHTKRAIVRALGLEYRLCAGELTITVHPLLEELVKIVEDVRGLFEPGRIGSERTDRASFSEAFQFGRRKVGLLEPPASLIDALQTSDFVCPLADSLTGSVPMEDDTSA